MDKDEIVVIDRSMRLHNDRVDKELEARSKEKMERAARKEQARLERRGLFDVLLDWTMGKKKVAKKAAEEKSQEQTIVRNSQKSR